MVLVDTLLVLILGLCLSAASGFRVFVPMLGLSIAALTGHVTLSPELAWIGTQPALIVTILAIVLPVAGLIVLLGIAYFVITRARRISSRSAARP